MNHALKLPPPNLESDLCLEQAIKRRRSTREYLDAPLSLEAVSQLLWAANGLTGERGLRTVPSAGALFPLEIRLVAGRVTGLQTGLYRYGSDAHELTQLTSVDARENLCQASFEQEWVRRAAAILAITGSIKDTTGKYGQRGMRYVHMQAGHSAQNIQLQAVSLGLSTVPVAAFDDRQVKAILNLPDLELPQYLVLIGTTTRQPVRVSLNRMEDHRSDVRTNGATALSLLLLLGLIGLGCKPAAQPEDTSTNTPPLAATSAPTTPPAPAVPERVEWTEEGLRAKLKETNPDYAGDGQFQIENGRLTIADLSGTGISDLSALSGSDLRLLDLRDNPITDLTPLAGLQLNELYLENTRAQDLTPLRGMPLMKLYLSGSPVKSLNGLQGAPLTSLNLLGAPVTDLLPLKGAPLEYVWLNETPVTDLNPLSECPLISLTLHRTQVADLTPLAGHASLQRLHIGDTPVTDLSPLQGMQLTRLIFNPSRIRRGMDLVRQMGSLQELGLTFEERMPPAQFWSRFGGQ